MKTTLTSLLTRLAGLLGPLSPFTKAVVPAGLSVAVAVVDSLFAGKIDASALTIAGTGLVLAVVAYLVPNLKAKPVAPAPSPAPTPPVK